MIHQGVQSRFRTKKKTREKSSPQITQISAPGRSEHNARGLCAPCVGCFIVASSGCSENDLHELVVVYLDPTILSKQRVVSDGLQVETCN